MEAEEGCICSGVWTFEVSDDMALAEASLAELLPVPNTRADDITIKPSKSMLLPAKTQVDAAEGADATLPPPGPDILEAQYGLSRHFCPALSHAASKHGEIADAVEHALHKAHFMTPSHMMCVTRRICTHCHECIWSCRVPRISMQ